MEIIKPKIFSQFKNLVFGFSTIKGGVSPSPYNLNLGLSVGDKKENVEKNRILFFDELNITADRVNYQKQIHSDIVKKIDKPGFAGECDATFTDKKNIFLTVSVADCVSVFLYEPNHNIIAGIHSGWKGTSLNIVGKAISEIKSSFNSQIHDFTFHCYIAPCISQGKFEVDKDVADLFPEEYVKYDKEKNKYFPDLKGIVLAQLIGGGVKKENIEASELCTFSEPGLLHSYRRDRDKSGRMYGVIGTIDN
ncbi:MAG TPA: peptidoglycan editing factor PgeF [Ignavibacteria bacterium]|nr:peptidoglycan editing factor PgeF [Ignavibacteria bacterium]